MRRHSFTKIEARGLVRISSTRSSTWLTRYVRFPRAVPSYPKTLRRRILRRFPFGFLYAIEPERIVIVAVAHLKRRPGYWKDRVEEDV